MRGKEVGREKCQRSLFIFGWQDETDIQMYNSKSLYRLRSVDPVWGSTFTSKWIHWLIHFYLYPAHGTCNHIWRIPLLWWWPDHSIKLILEPVTGPAKASRAPIAISTITIGPVIYIVAPEVVQSWHNALASHVFLGFERHSQSSRHFVGTLPSKILRVPWFKPRAAGWKSRALPLCYAAFKIF